MANPTTNYSFAMPTNTDLVKDLPADFDIFGQAVDDRIKALNPETTLGDIAYRSSTANTNTRLGIGTTGQVLAVSGGVPAWTTVSSGGMTLLSTTTLSSTTTTISGIAGGYKDLVITVIGATTSTADGLFMRLNGQTGSIYDQTKLRTTNNTVSGQYAQTSFNLGSTTSTTNNNEFVICTIHDYTETIYKSILCNGIRAAVGFYEVYAMQNYNTAIDSVTFFPVTSPFTMTGGTVKIYGVK
jgi:hypothetical protein